jgi:hypothetical protein
VQKVEQRRHVDHVFAAKLNIVASALRSHASLRIAAHDNVVSCLDTISRKE